MTIPTHKTKSSQTYLYVIKFRGMIKYYIKLSTVQENEISDHLVRLASSWKPHPINYICMYVPSQFSQCNYSFNIDLKGTKRPTHLYRKQPFTQFYLFIQSWTIFIKKKYWYLRYTLCLNYIYCSPVIKIQ